MNPLKWQVTALVSSHLEHPVTFLRPTSSSQKHQYLPEYTEAPKSKTPVATSMFFCPSASCHPTVPALPHLYMAFFFFYIINMSFQLVPHISNAKKTSAFLLPDSKVKFTFFGLQGGMLPFGALDQIWGGLHVRYHLRKLGCWITATL